MKKINPKLILIPIGCVFLAISLFVTSFFVSRQDEGRLFDETDTSEYASNEILSSTEDEPNGTTNPVVSEEHTNSTTDEIVNSSETVIESSTTEKEPIVPSTTNTHSGTTKPSSTSPSTSKPSTTVPSTTKPSTTTPSVTNPKPSSPSTTKPSSTSPPTTSVQIPTVSVVKDSDIVAITNGFLRLVNEERARCGVHPLQSNSVLKNAANQRSKELLTTFSHTRPNGSSFYTIIPSSYPYYNIGENVAYTSHMGDKSFTKKDLFVGTDAQIVAAYTTIFNNFKNSQGHYANMINDKFYDTGIGISYRIDESTGMAVFYVCQIFGRPAQ